jgi:hypothetical protein
MKRIAISLVVGTAFTLGTPIIAALVLFPSDRNPVGGLLLFWPLMLIERLGFSPDCANANSVSEKLTCIRVSLLIDLVCYPLMIGIASYAVHIVLSRRKRA